MQGSQSENHTEEVTSEHNVPHQVSQTEGNTVRAAIATNIIAQLAKKGPAVDKTRLEKLISDSNKRRTRYQRD